MTPISRRDFVALAAAGAVATPFALKDGVARASAAVTAQEIVDRIKKNVGVDWSSDDVDTFKIGDPSTVVTGVVTTSMATLDVLQKAVQAGANFVITAAPTFYTRADLSTPAGARARPGWRRRPRSAPGSRRGSWSRRGSGTGERQRAGHRRLGAHAAGTRDAAVGRAAGPACRGGCSGHASAAGSRLRRQERLHRETQAGRVSPDAALEPAQARSARPGSRDGDGLDEIQSGRRCAALRRAGDHARCARQPVEEEPRHAGRHPRDRRPRHDGAAYRAAAGVHA